MSNRPRNEGRPHTAPVPPSRISYYQHRCRCDECRSANSAYHLAARYERRDHLAAEFDTLPHGDVSTYNNWGCRCVACAEAKSVENALQAAIRKYATAEVDA